MLAFERCEKNLEFNIKLRKSLRRKCIMRYKEKVKRRILLYNT